MTPLDVHAYILTSNKICQRTNFVLSISGLSISGFEHGFEFENVFLIIEHHPAVWPLWGVDFFHQAGANLKYGWY
jgi:hypothetical protein